MAEARPLNLLTSVAFLMKSFRPSDAWSLVLIESIGNRARSIERPAIPPDATAIAKVLGVKVYATTLGLSSAIGLKYYGLN